MKKNVLKVIVFIVLLVTCVSYVNQVLRYKFYDGIYHVDKFYDLEEESVDVLVLGSSHAYADINPAILYKQYGIASYNLCASAQALWNTYHYLEEALKTQKPKLIVLEAYRVCETLEYMDDSRIIKSNFGLKFSLNKINSIIASAPEDRWSYFAKEWIHYHNRYESITEKDFLGYPEDGVGDIDVENFKGFINYLGVTEFQKPEVNEDTSAALSEKTETYYRKIIELAEKNEIPILIVVSPYSGYTQEQARMYNSAQEIADEYGVPFINYNKCYEEIGLNFLTDCHDSGHLNYRGSAKFTTVLGDYIAQNYQIPDRRNNEEYYSWELNAAYYEQIINNMEWKNIVNLREYIERMKVKQADYLYVVSLTEENEDNADIIELQDISGGECMLFINAYGEVIYDIQSPQKYFYHMEIGGSDLAVSGESAENHESGLDFSQSIVIDKVEQTKVKKGINIVVWDKYTEKIVDSVGFAQDNNYQAIR